MFQVPGRLPYGVIQADLDLIEFRGAGLGFDEDRAFPTRAVKS